MSMYSCNSAIVRFMPYRETGEFANIGVVLCCPELGYLHFKVEQRKRKRIFDFFPELQRDVLVNGLKAVQLELERTSTTQQSINQTYLFPDTILSHFREIVKHKEGVFQFSEPRMMLTKNPEDTLNDIFADVVLRQFAENKEYHEKVMVERIKTSLKEWKLDKYYQKTYVGTPDIYCVNFPLAYTAKGVVLKAIKPLNLNKETSSMIYDHGDDWIGKIKRLDRNNFLPHDLMFVIEYPDQDTKTRQAANDICKELELLKIKVIPSASHDAIMHWAKVS